MNRFRARTATTPDPARCALRALPAAPSADRLVGAVWSAAPAARAVRSAVRVGRAALVAGITLAALAACNSGSPSGSAGTPSATAPTSSVPTTEPSASPTSPAPAPPSATSGVPDVGGAVILERTGGFAGVRQRVVIQPDGAWTYTERDGRQQVGRLTPAQTDQLRRLVGGPSLAAEAKATQSNPGKCADGFLYTLNANHLVVRSDDCGSTDTKPTLNAIVKLVAEATPM